ncbi:MAG TPA: quinolinate synthase [Opitutae bacterium]|nr:quinolinate synthase [Opitutae bacterium]
MIKATTEAPPLQVFRQSADSVVLNSEQNEIVRLKEEANAVLLCHNYQIEAIQQVADYVGDSLGLARQAAETDADVIVFCGVHFMAETAKILNPAKKVLLPDLNAGCSLSDSCPAEKLAAYKDENPDLYVVAYVNCSAAVKALSDVICTSGNAMQIVGKVPENREILFVPDQNLGQWVSAQTGRHMRLWPGSCYAHVLFTKESIERCRLEYPNAPVVAHPECVDSVRDLADEVCSTEKMVGFCRDHPSETFIILTETGMMHRLTRELPEKSFVVGPTSYCACNDCRFMKMNTLPKLLSCLHQQGPEIILDDQLIEQAKLPIERMLEWS